MSGFVWDWSFALSVVPDLLMGIRITIFATLVGSLLAFVLGLVWVVIRFAQIPVLTPVVVLFIQFVRGTPLLVQLYFLFYVLPTWGISLSALVTGILGLGLFYSAYAAEIYRAGIEEVPAGQWEASLTLGLPLWHLWLGIVLPQALRTVLPVLGNQVVAMFKETALLSTITVMEMAAEAKNIGSIEFRYIEPLTLAGFFYFIISYAASRMFRSLETPHAAHS